MTTATPVRSDVPERLARAAVALSIERGGLDAVSVSEIADAAALSRRTFFNHFPSKESALLWPLRQVTETLCASFAARPEDEPVWQALEAATMQVLALPEPLLLLTAQADRVIEASPTLLSSELSDERLQRHFDEIVRRSGAEPATDPLPHLLGTTSYAALRLGLKLWMLGGVPPQRTTAAAFALAGGGLAMAD